MPIRPALGRVSSWLSSGDWSCPASSARRRTAAGGTRSRRPTPRPKTQPPKRRCASDATPTIVDAVDAATWDRLRLASRVIAAGRSDALATHAVVAAAIRDRAHVTAAVTGTWWSVSRSAGSTRLARVASCWALGVAPGHRRQGLAGRLLARTSRNGNRACGRGRRRRDHPRRTRRLRAARPAHANEIARRLLERAGYRVTRVDGGRRCRRSRGDPGHPARGRPTMTDAPDAARPLPSRDIVDMRLLEAMATGGCPVCVVRARSERATMDAIINERVLDLGFRAELERRVGLLPPPRRGARPDGSTRDRRDPRLVAAPERRHRSSSRRARRTASASAAGACVRVCRRRASGRRASPARRARPRSRPRLPASPSASTTRDGSGRSPPHRSASMTSSTCGPSPVAARRSTRSSAVSSSRFRRCVPGSRASPTTRVTIAGT